MCRRYLPENKLSKNKIRTPISKCHRGQVREVYAAKSCVCPATELEADVSLFFLHAHSGFYLTGFHPQKDPSVIMPSLFAYYFYF